MLSVRTLRGAPAYVVAVVALTAVVVDGTFNDVGHLLALLLGFAIGSVGRVHEGVRHGPQPAVVDDR